MGRINFRQNLYQPAVEALGGGIPTVKMSFFSDTYDASQNYAGMIVYKQQGDFKWHNTAGKAKGYNGRFLYVSIQNVRHWPRNPVPHIVKDVIGTGSDDPNSLVLPSDLVCGGFAITEGELKFSSNWLNECGDSDHSKYMSPDEQKIIEFVVEQWKVHGKHQTWVLPEYLHHELMVNPKSSSDHKKMGCHAGKSSSEGETMDYHVGKSSLPGDYIVGKSSLDEKAMDYHVGKSSLDF